MPVSAQQQTVNKTIVCQGVGVHSGLPATLTLRPAPTGSGIVFIRTDIRDRDNLIPARWDHVTDTRLCTVLANAAGASVSTVEHVLSALYGCSIDNAILEIDGPEIPIMDGSAAPFVAMIDAAGIVVQTASRKAIRILKPVVYEEGDKRAELRPAEGFCYGFEISFPTRLIGTQRQFFNLVNGTYRKQISQARTFGFLHEVEHLRKLGLARGGSLENAIVIDGDRVLNEGGLRFADEFVRHKILDAIGDLYLAGAPIIGEFYGIKAGHALNNRILHTLFADATAWEWVDMAAENRIPALQTDEVMAATATITASRLRGVSAPQRRPLAGSTRGETRGEMEDILLHA